MEENDRKDEPNEIMDPAAPPQTQEPTDQGDGATNEKAGEAVEDDKTGAPI